MFSQDVVTRIINVKWPSPSETVTITLEFGGTSEIVPPAAGTATKSDTIPHLDNYTLTWFLAEDFRLVPDGFTVQGDITISGGSLSFGAGEVQAVSHADLQANVAATGVGAATRGPFDLHATATLGGLLEWYGIVGNPSTDNAYEVTGFDVPLSTVSISWPNLTLKKDSTGAIYDMVLYQVTYQTGIPPAGPSVVLRFTFEP